MKRSKMVEEKHGGQRNGKKEGGLEVVWGHPFLCTLIIPWHGERPVSRFIQKINPFIRNVFDFWNNLVLNYS